MKGIETQTGKTFLGPVILATGHSARDVYRWLAANKVPIEAKGIAVGVRLEHPAGLIDQIQYHNRNGRGKYLPAAEYSFVTQVEGRGYTASACVREDLSYLPPAGRSRWWSMECRPPTVAPGGATRAWWWRYSRKTS